MKLILSSVLLILITSCKKTSNIAVPPKSEEINRVSGNSLSNYEENAFVESIEKKHHKLNFLKNEAVSYELKVSFDNTVILEGTVTQMTNGSKIRIDNQLDNSKIIFDNKDVFIVPSEIENPMARFHVFTWSYFFSLPYKLSDSGTIWNNPSKKKWGSSLLDTYKLTFEEGTGDAPKDWYVVYKNRDHLLVGAAYIVSYGKGVESAEKEPHAIKYNNFIDIKGIPIATNWTFHMWDIASGYGAQIGEVELKNIRFLENTSELFKRPKNSRDLVAPVNK